jgi:formate/nitrite transporter FocA (FNT family)
LLPWTLHTARADKRSAAARTQRVETALKRDQGEPLPASIPPFARRSRLADDPQSREDDIDLTQEEREAVDERELTSARVLHEVIRRGGDEELDRPALSLMWSGLAGGIAICASVLGQALIESRLPDAPWRPLVASFGYTLGFLIVILGRLQLFTESTLSAVIPVVTHLSLSNFGRLARLWGLVLAFNLLGTLLIAGATEASLIGSPEQRDAMLAVSRKLLEHDWLATVKLGIPAGFLIAAVPWILPAARGQIFWIVLALTYFIGLGGFAHAVAGSCEAWLLAAAGETSFTHAAFGLILPALIGNIIGGTGLFALLAHAQVRQEL